MKYLDLFSGIGGFHLGIKQTHLDWECIGFSEIDKYAISVYQKQFQGVKNYGDITAIRASGLPDLELVTFGFPCQDLSLAGNRAGLAGSRSGLFGEAMRIIRAKRPRLIIFENVKGLFSSGKRKDFAFVLQEITDAGYDCQWQLLNTAWFLPQSRERIYLVGHIRGTRRPEVFPIGEGSCKSDEVQQEKRGEGQRFSSEVQESKDRQYERTKSRRGLEGRPYRVGTLRTYNDGKGFREVKGAGRKRRTICARNDGTGQPVVIVQKDNYIVHNMQPRSPHRPSCRDKKRGGSGHLTKNDGTSYCLDSTPQGSEKEGMFYRRLTPKEYERLQGFPDDWTRYGVGGKEISDSQRYKMLGNAVSVPVIKAVMERVR